MDEKYNGYTNFQTWLVVLWIDSTEGSYRYFKELSKQYDDKYDFGKAIDEYFHEMNPMNLINNASVYSDLLNSAMAKVDWYEIAQYLMED